MVEIEQGIRFNDTPASISPYARPRISSLGIFKEDVIIIFIIALFNGNQWTWYVWLPDNTPNSKNSRNPRGIIVEKCYQYKLFW